MTPSRDDALRRSRHRDEQGSIIPLVIGFLLIIGVLVAVVVDASAAYLQRQGLVSIADGAALAATEGVSGEALYREGIGERLQIDPGTARRYAAAYLFDVGAAQRFPGIDLDVVVDTDRVVVQVSAPLDLPLGVPGVAPKTTVTATAGAMVRVRR